MRYPVSIEARERYRAIRRVLVVEMALNLVVAAAKGVFGVATGALAIAADAIHSLVDAASNIAGMVLLGLASRPPDDEHPYGHRKIEVVAAAAIGVAIGSAGLRFGWSAIEALVEGREAPATSILGFAIIGATWLINVFVAIYESRRARQLDSAFLAADAAHTASDVVVTGAVMASYAAAHLGIWWADPVGALLVIAIIGRVAYQILARNLGVLVDQAVLDAERVIEVASAVDGVRAVHRVRSRGSRDAIHVDLHVLMANDLSLREAHAIAHRVEDVLEATWPAVVDVTVHMEPEDSGHEEL